MYTYAVLCCRVVYIVGVEVYDIIIFSFLGGRGGGGGGKSRCPLPSTCLYVLSPYFLPYLQEIRSLRAKHRPRSHDDQIQYKPAVGRDTNTGPLVATKVGWRVEREGGG